MYDFIKNRLRESIDIKNRILQDEGVVEGIGFCATMFQETISNGGKVLVCGNGGSASDSLHLVGEIVGRFQKERMAWPALALASDVAVMTAIANDYGYDEVFARQVEGLMNGNDILLGISTSGDARNVYKAIQKANQIGGKTVGLLGKGGGKIASITDCSIIVPSGTTARIQEAHITIIHILCEILEETLTGGCCK